MTIRYGVYGILVHEGAVLMVQTRSGGLDIWNFPGGGIDAGETPLQALVRECHEEIGAAVNIYEELYVQHSFIHPTLGHKSVMTYYRITLADNAQIDYQLEGARWVALDALPFDEMLSVDQEMARLLWCL
jgi:mutator protein MutT